MGNEFLSPRWHGRLFGLIIKVAKKRGVYFYEGQQVTFLDLFMATAKKASEEEMNVINSLMKTTSDITKDEEEKGITISEEEHDRLHDIGIQEAFAICNRRLPIDVLTTDKDIMAEEKVRRMEEEKQRAEQEKIQAEQRKKNAIITWSVIGAIILAIIIYNLPYFKEMRFFNKIMEGHTVYDCESYYSKYPNGRYYEDVMNMELELAEQGEGDKPVAVLTRYLHKFPDGKYAPQFNVKCDSLWDIEIAKYNQRDKSQESPEAVKFMTEMLAYMKAKRVNAVNLKINPTVHLKDYSEYDGNTKALLSLLYAMEKVNIDTTMILSLKANFTEQDRSVLVDILAQGMEKSFGRMFSSDFVAINTNSNKFDETSPDITINYEIKNQEFEIVEQAMPEIWTYKEQNAILRNQYHIKGYILGIDVKFDTTFTIPGSSTTYPFAEIGEPGKVISNIQSLSEGYRLMTQMCFAKFSNKMSDNLGLEEIDFRGDDDEEYEDE